MTTEFVASIATIAETVPDDVTKNASSPPGGVGQNQHQSAPLLQATAKALPRKGKGKGGKGKGKGKNGAGKSQASAHSQQPVADSLPSAKGKGKKGKGKGKSKNQ